MIILIGYMGSGKSVVGKRLASQLNLPFLDFDSYIETQEGASVSALFKEKGEIYFRKKEHFYLNELLEQKKEIVLSLGGGTPCYSNNMKYILAATPNVFYINVSIGELVTRLNEEKAHRPVIAHLSEEDLPEFIGKHLFERNPFYQQAHHQIVGTNKSVETIAAEIAVVLEAKDER